MNKGYIVPIILIVLLLVLAGFFVFAPVQSPVITDKIPPQTTTIKPVPKEDPLEVPEQPATTTDIESEEPEDVSTSTESF